MKRHTVKPFLLLATVLILPHCDQSKRGDQQDDISNEQQSEETGMLTLYAGTYTNGASEGIYRLQFDNTTGALDLQGLVAATANPSYIALSPDNQTLFGVNELANGTVSVFQRNEETFNLTQTIAIEGAAPCYIARHPKQDLLAVANYMSGTTSVLVKESSGWVLDNTLEHKGMLGSNEERQEAPHGHFSDFYKGFLFTVDLGIDEIIAFEIDEPGVVGSGNTAFKLNSGDGPRHLAFHPSRDIVFVVNELSNTVVSMSLDSSKGQLREISRVGTLPDDFSGQSQCADIHISKDGKFVYASNRGHDSIVVFAVQESGALVRTGIVSTRGDWPRNFVLSPDNRWLLVANEHSGNITVFSRDAATGLLTFSGIEVEVSNPTCLKFENS